MQIQPKSPASLSVRFLRRALFANALFSSLTGSGQLLFAGTLTPLLALELAPAVLPAIGAGLLAFAGYVFWLATQPKPDRFLCLLVSLADLAWVGSSVVLLIAARDQLAPTGLLLIGLTAGIVLLLALLQLHGLARSFRASPGSREIRVCVEVSTPAAADILWLNVEQLGRIADFMPSLASSSLRGGAAPGVGAIRDCADHRGRHWSECCTRWAPMHREFDVAFLTDEPGFPFPFSQLRGGWQVTPSTTGATVRVWWQGSLRHPLLTPLVLPLMEWQAQRDIAGVVQRLAGLKLENSRTPSVKLIASPC